MRNIKLTIEYDGSKYNGWQTQKNAMVSNLYEKLGFVNVGDNLFKAEVDKYVPHKTYIK